MSSHQYQQVTPRPSHRHDFFQRRTNLSVSIRDVELGDLVGLGLTSVPFLSTICIIVLYSTPTWFQDLVFSPIVFGITLVWIAIYLKVETAFASTWQGSNFITEVVTDTITSCVVEKANRPLHKLVQLMWRVMFLPVFFLLELVYYSILLLLYFVLTQVVWMPLKGVGQAICSICNAHCKDNNDHPGEWRPEMEEHKLAPEGSLTFLDDAEKDYPGTFVNEKRPALNSVSKEVEDKESLDRAETGDNGNHFEPKLALPESVHVSAAVDSDEDVVRPSSIVCKAADLKPQHIGAHKARYLSKVPQKTTTGPRVREQAQSSHREHVTNARESEEARMTPPKLTVDASPAQSTGKDLEELREQQAKLEARLAVVTGERDALSTEAEAARARAVKAAETRQLELTMAENRAAENQHLRSALTSERETVAQLAADLRIQFERAAKAETEVKALQLTPGLTKDQAAEYQKLQAALVSEQDGAAHLKDQVLAQFVRADRAEADLAVVQQDRQSLNGLFQTISGDHRDKTIMSLGLKYDRQLTRYQAAKTRIAKLEKNLQSAKDNRKLFGDLISNEFKTLKQHFEQQREQNKQLQSMLKDRDLKIEELESSRNSKQELIQKLIAGNEKPKAEAKSTATPINFFALPDREMVPAPTQNAFEVKKHPFQIDTTFASGHGGVFAFGAPQNRPKHVQVRASGTGPIPEASLYSKESFQQTFKPFASRTPMAPQDSPESPHARTSLPYDPFASLARETSTTQQQPVAPSPVIGSGPKYAPGGIPAPQGPSQNPSRSSGFKPAGAWLFGKQVTTGVSSDMPATSTTQKGGYISDLAAVFAKIPPPSQPMSTSTTTQAAVPGGVTGATRDNGVASADIEADDDDPDAEILKAQEVEEENEKRRGRGERGW